MDAMLAPSASMETTATFFSVLRMFAIGQIDVDLLLTETRIASTYLLTKMKNKLGRPKIARQHAKGELFAARFTAAEAKPINAAIRSLGEGKTAWIRKALLSAAGIDNSAS